MKTNVLDIFKASLRTQTKHWNTAQYNTEIFIRLTSCLLWTDTEKLKKANTERERERLSTDNIQFSHSAASRAVNRSRTHGLAACVCLVVKGFPVHFTATSS